MFMRSDKSSTNHQCQISSLPCLIHLPILGTSGFVASSPSASPSDLAQMPPGRKGQRCTRETPDKSLKGTKGQSHVFKLLSLHERVVFTFFCLSLQSFLLSEAVIKLDFKESCVKNKLNRKNVQYQQCTCSQSYIAKAIILHNLTWKKW
ncbi:uncharacterized protein [Zea mays]|uniref:uncharacterized protein isoform X4 n=1 Tax=Zea mays TaxID=4577 RepID=UPI001651B6BE|nr:uncharacterized protein LOC100192854 isoform X4 [Zea mays]XP_035821693.1 uncharacterized protein LOC100278387 isoform X2 [Zea mays]